MNLENWQIYYTVCLVCSILISATFILSDNGFIRFGLIIFFISCSIALAGRLFFTDLVEEHRLNEILIIPVGIGFIILTISTIPFLYKQLFKLFKKEKLK